MNRPLPLLLGLLLPGLAAAGQIDDLAPRLRHADPETRRAAQREVARIAHDASRPAPTAEPRGVTARELVAALGARPPLPSDSADAVIRAVARTANDADSIEALGRLADDPALADRVFEALGAIPHPRAVTELIRRLPDERALIALSAQGERAGDDAVGALLAVAVDLDPARAASARRALANTGHPDAEPSLLGAAGRGSEGAADDLLRWAERTSDRARSARSYRALLDSSEPHLRAAALVGLGRIGDGTDVPALVDRLDDDDATVRGAAREALVRCTDHEVEPALERRFDDERATRRDAALAILAARGAAAAPPRIVASLDARDEALRRTALALAADLQDPSLPEVLLRIAAESEGAVRDAALDAALAHARRRALAGDAAAARDLLHRTLSADGSSDVTRRVLVILAMVPDPSSLARLDALGAAPPEEASRARLAIARALAATDPDRARAQFDRVAVDTRSRAQRDAALAGLTALGVDVSQYPKRAGFLTDWHVIGPFPEATADDLGTPAFPLDPVALETTRDGKDGPVRWIEVSTHDMEGLVDFVQLIGGEHAVAYAATEFEARDGPGKLKVGSDDGVAVWLNGELVHDHFVWRGVVADADVIDVRFVDGTNRLVVKVSNGGGGWGVCVRVAEADGTPIDLRSAEF